MIKTTIHPLAAHPAVRLILTIMAVPPDEPRAPKRYVSLDAIAEHGQEPGVGKEDNVIDVLDATAPTIACPEQGGVGEIAICMHTLLELADILGMAEVPTDPAPIRRDRREENRVRATQQLLQRYQLAHVIPGTKRWILTLDQRHAVDLRACLQRRRAAIVEAVWALA